MLVTIYHYSPRQLCTSSRTSGSFPAAVLWDPSSCCKPNTLTASLLHRGRLGISFYHFGDSLSIFSASWILSSLFFYFCETYLLETTCERVHGCTFFETVFYETSLRYLLTWLGITDPWNVTSIPPLSFSLPWGSPKLFSVLILLSPHPHWRLLSGSKFH